MFNIGFSEMILILLVAFLVVGPRDLPKVARALARGLKRLRGLVDELKREANWEELIGEVDQVRGEVEGAIDEADVTREVRQTVQTVKTDVSALKAAATGDIRGAVDALGHLKEDISIIENGRK